jgi:hypothetical protein
MDLFKWLGLNPHIYLALRRRRWYNDCCQDPMITRKLQSRKGHVFHILLVSRIVLPRAQYCKILLGKENKVLGIHVSLFSFLTFSTSLVELRLQIGPGIERGVIGRIGHVSPTRRESVVHVSLTEIEHVLLLAGFGVFVRVRVQTKNETVFGQGRSRLHCLDNGIEDRFGRQAVRVAVKRGNHVINMVDAGRRHGQNITGRHWHIDARGKGRLHIVGNFATGARGKRGTVQAHDRILVADRVHFARRDNVKLASEGTIPGLINKGGRYFL